MENNPNPNIAEKINADQIELSNENNKTTNSHIESKEKRKFKFNSISKFEKISKNGISFGEVVEFYGSSNSGKSEFLYSVLIQCVLPKKFDDVEIGGEGIGVLFFDNENRFDIVRVIQLLEFKLKKLLRNEKSLKTVLEMCLERIVLIKCTDDFQFFSSLMNVPHLMKSNSSIKVIMIDGLASFFFLDKSNSYFQRQTRIVKQINKIKNEFQILIFVTKSAFFKKKESLEHKEILVKCWLDFVNHRISCKRTSDPLVEGNQSFVAQMVSNNNNSPQQKQHTYTIDQNGIRFE